MRARLIGALVFVFLFALVVACSDGFPKEFAAPDFTLKSPIMGDAVTLYDLKGRPVIIYWFTSW